MRDGERGRPRLLVLAGHDPTGGAGVDADRAAAAAQGVEALCVVTARTEQDGVRVQAVGARPVADWWEEALEVLRARPDALEIGALKTGLLPDADAVTAAARLVRRLRERGPLPVVVDPVLAASGGERFLDDAGVERLRTELIPEGVVLTPNLPEAARLAGVPEASLRGDPDALARCGEALLALGARAVVLKGGHDTGAMASDLVLERGRPPFRVEAPRLPGVSLHGSGCRHASSLAAALARGLDLPAAAEVAFGAVRRVLEELEAGP